MSSTEKEKSSKIILYILVFGFMLAASVFSSMNVVRTFFMSHKTSERTILAKLTFPVGEKTYMVFKIKTEFGLLVEIFEKAETENQKLKQKFEFLDEKEAFLMVNSNAENLFTIDYDKNGTDEIVAPTIDKQGQSRLNILYYNFELDQFQLSFVENQN